MPDVMIQDETALAVTNNSTQDTSSPTLTSGSVQGNTLTLNFSEPVTRGNGHSDSDLTVKRTGGNDLTPTYSSGDGTSTLTFTLPASIAATESVSLDYTQPGDGLEDSAGNDVASFTDRLLANNTTSGGGAGIFGSPVFGGVA